MSQASPGDRVIVTGGGGFLGRRLIAELQSSANAPAHSRPETIVAIDVVPAEVAGCVNVQSDLSSAAVFEPFLADGPATIYHLASVVSAGAEADWEAAIGANLGGMLRLLEACRGSGHVHRLVFASSVAVLGGALADSPVGDMVKQTPDGTYGMTKAMGEMLVNDCTRKGHIDGRSARLPTVVVRPGKPNAAASGFASGLFREPLQGVPADVPVGLDAKMVLTSPDSAVGGLLALGQIDGDALGKDRAVSLPGLTATVGEMLEVLETVGGAKARQLATLRYDAGVDALVSSWPGHLDDSRGRALGLPADSDLESIVRAFVDQQLDGRTAFG
jgi:nucleoside-diphosphate-sugar epimerase